MIKEEHLQREHLDNLKAKYPSLSPRLIEKMIRALRVLELLSQSKRPFIFKGGTALMLLLGEAKRLSIDLDLAIDEPQSDVLPWLVELLPSGYSAKTTFISQDGVPKNHYRVFYQTALDGDPQEDSIKIDVLFSATKYPVTQQTAITLPIIGFSEQPIFVQTPDLHSILGDKLTAFGPNTVGVPFRRAYGEPSQLEVIKQMHDIAAIVSQLADEINFTIVKQTYQFFVEQEASFRKINCNWEMCLEDAFQTALCLLSGGKIGGGQDIMAQLKMGTQTMDSYVFARGGYQRINQISDATKVCWLTTTLLQESEADILLPSEIAWQNHRMPHKSLNVLKNVAPHLLSYWAAILSMPKQFNY